MNCPRCDRPLPVLYEGDFRLYGSCRQRGCFKPKRK